MDSASTNNPTTWRWLRSAGWPASLGLLLATVCTGSFAVATITVGDKSVSYWSAAQGSTLVGFQLETQGYRNGYTLDCAKRQFLWTKNVRLSTGQATDNNAGAEWRPMTPDSSVSNAVYDAICPQLLAQAAPSTAPNSPAAQTTPPSATAELAASRPSVSNPTDAEHGAGTNSAIHTPGSSGQTIPTVFQGSWDEVQQRCEAFIRDSESGTGLQISANGIRYYEDRCTLNQIIDTTEDRFAGRFDCSGEGEEWTEEITLALDKGMLVHHGKVQVSRPLTRCTAAFAVATASTPPPSGSGMDRMSVKDGSLITGTVLEDKVPFATSFGPVEVDLTEVRSFTDEALHLADGSVLKGHFGEAVIEIATARGILKVPAQDIVGIVRADSKAMAAVASPQAQSEQSVPPRRVIDRSESEAEGPSKDTVLEQWHSLLREKQENGSCMQHGRFASVEVVGITIKDDSATALVRVTGSVALDLGYFPKSLCYGLTSGKVKETKRLFVYQKFGSEWQYVGNAPIQ